jgi:hypothetical protein
VGRSREEAVRMAGLTEIRGFRGELLGPEDAGYDQA